MKARAVAILLLAMFASSTSSAKETGFELGARLGIAFPAGDVADEDDADLDDWQQRQIPLWLDLGYRASGSVFVGAYLSYGFASVGSTFDDLCDLDDVDCSARSLRFGAQMQFHFMPQERTDAWLGLGIGWERASLSFEGPVEDISLSLNGLEWLMLQGGVDFQVAEAVAIGPFLALSISQFSSVDCDGSDVVCTVLPDDIDDKAFHQWLFFGVRGAFGPL